MTAQTSLFRANAPSIDQSPRVESSYARRRGLTAATGLGDARRSADAAADRRPASESRQTTTAEAGRDTRYWVGVVSAEHVQRGVCGGFAQLCHGKAAPLTRMRPGDWLIYYSPAESMRGGEPVQAFTAIGRVRDGAAYEFDMGGGFVPFRRDVEYLPCRAAPIHPLLADLSFLPDKARWGYVFRRGHVQIPREDFLLMARAIGVDPDPVRASDGSADQTVEMADG
jgi:EVE domain